MPGTHQTELSANGLVGVCDPGGNPVGSQGRWSISQGERQWKK